MRLLLILGLALFCSCGATRKLSRVELREPSSIMGKSSALSDRRIRISSYMNLPKQCPEGIRKFFPILSSETVRIPVCPKGLDEFQSAIPFLNLEERVMLEEVINNQCRSISRAQFGESLEHLHSNFDSTGPMGRWQSKQLSMASEQLLTKLKKSIEEIIRVHLPIDRWVAQNGEFVVPEEDLISLDKLFIIQQCKMSDAEVDQTYRTILSLENLSHVLEDSEQKRRLDLFLNGVHAVIDQKVKEYFNP